MYHKHRCARQGVGVTFARDSLGMGAFFLSFNATKRLLARHSYGDRADTKPPDFDVLLLSGSTAGLSFWIGVSLRFC